MRECARELMLLLWGVLKELLFFRLRNPKTKIPLYPYIPPTNHLNRRLSCKNLPLPCDSTTMPSNSTLMLL